MYPFGYDCDKHAKDESKWDRVGKAATTGIKKLYKTQFTYGPICKTIYQASGSSIDWSYENGGVKYPFAIELRYS